MFSCIVCRIRNADLVLVQDTPVDIDVLYKFCWIYERNFNYHVPILIAFG